MVIRIQHVDRELATASLKNLTLEHSAADDSWSLGAAEVQRIRAAGTK